MSVVGPIVLLFVVFLSSGFRSPLSYLFCFITVFMLIFVSLCCFTEAQMNMYLLFGAASLLRVMFRASKNWLESQYFFLPTI